MLKLVLSAVAVFVVLASVPMNPPRANAAPPADGVYDIGVLDCTGCWNSGDFPAMANSPGIFSFTVTEITSADIASFGDYDVIIFPYYDLGTVSPDLIDALVEFVIGGGTLTLEINGSGTDPILAAFGSDYAATWVSISSGESVLIADATNPINTTPNPLTSAGMSNWGDSFHAVITDMGPAWQIAHVTNPQIDIVQGAITACAAAGQGSIVLTGTDVEGHADAIIPESFLYMENMAVVNRSGACSGDDDRSILRRPRVNLGGLFASSPNPNNNNNQPAAQPQATSPSTPVLRPPSTGDAGLASSTSVWTPALVGMVTITLVSLVSLKLVRRR